MGRHLGIDFSRILVGFRGQVGAKLGSKIDKNNVFVFCCFYLFLLLFLLVLVCCFFSFCYRFLLFFWCFLLFFFDFRLFFVVFGFFFPYFLGAFGCLFWDSFLGTPLRAIK